MAGVHLGGSIADFHDHEHAFAHAQGGGETAGDTGDLIGLHGKTVYDQFDVVCLVAVHLHLGAEVEDFSIDSDLGVALFA